MARTELEPKRRSGLGWIWWLLILAILALVIWWLWQGAAGDDLETVEDPAVEGAMIEGGLEPTEPEPLAGNEQMSFVPVGEVIGAPDGWLGRTIDGDVNVVEVPTDRGFWIEQDGQRLFALIIDQPAEVPKDINSGQTLRITGGEFRDPSALGTLEGEPLDEQTRQIAEQQRIFLVVDESEIEIVEEA